MLYWIGYDLDKPGQDYQDVIAQLEAWGAIRVLLSDWLLESGSTPQEIHDALRICKMDASDRLMVSEVFYNAAWTNLFKSNDDVLALYNRAARRG